MPNISEKIQEGAKILRHSGVAEPRREASSLLAFALQKEKTFLIAHPEYRLTESEQNLFQELLARRSQREPFQHITGRQEFYGLDFAVNSDVLIPRPETEMIVENAVEILQKMKNPYFCEVGIGSGCISVSLLHHVLRAKAIGLDISSKALAVSRANAERHRVTDRLELRISDVFSSLNGEKFPLLISNPPYIPMEELPFLQPEVGSFEPLTALTDGKDGLSIIEKIIADSPQFLTSDAFLLLEIGINQAEKVRNMFCGKIWHSVEILPDLQGIPRMVRAGRA